MVEIDHSPYEQIIKKTIEVSLARLQRLLLRYLKFGRGHVQTKKTHSSCSCFVVCVCTQKSVHTDDSSKGHGHDSIPEYDISYIYICNVAAYRMVIVYIVGMNGNGRGQHCNI